MDIPRWLHGPFELIRHAYGHLQKGKDVDRRIALIGFDNAVEICIDVFIKLHPKLRDGVEIKKEVQDQACRNFHTKLDFLDEYSQTMTTPLAVPTNEILWFHSLRNDLYHSGNGMVPQATAVEGARDAALETFRVLFGLDIRQELEHSGPLLEVEQDDGEAGTESSTTAFMHELVEVERALKRAVYKASGGERSPSDNTEELWKQYIHVTFEPQDEYESMLYDALVLRNKIAHGEVVSDEHYMRRLTIRLRQTRDIFEEIVASGI